MNQTPNNLAAYIWSLADLLRGDFKQSQYGRLECVLAGKKEAVLAEYDYRVQSMPEEALTKPGIIRTIFDPTAGTVDF
ncbi:MAG: hypothetical protein CMK89_07275 [Pseudomonadales bacterium]|nr:hypothetical protein [Pseudomonadales bacterium]